MTEREKKIAHLEKLSTIFDEYATKVAEAGRIAGCYSKEPEDWPDELLNYTIEETMLMVLKIQAL